MKRMKKLASIMLALVMALVMTVPAFAMSQEAQAPNDATITIHNAAKGAKYTVYKVFSATYSGTGADQLVAYTYDGSKETWDAQSSTLDKYFTLTPSTGVVEPKAGVDISKIFTANDEEQISNVNALKNALKNIATQVDEKTATDGNDIVINGLSYGYYLVYSDRGNDGTAIAISNATKDAVMYDKNVSYPTWGPDGKKIVIVNAQGDEEEVSVNSVGYGEEVTFRLHITTQNYALKNPTDPNSEYKQIQRYIINDNLAGGKFDLVEDSVSVKVNNESAKTTVTTGTNPNGFSVTIPWVNESGESVYEAGTEMVIEYKATLKENAEIAGAGNTNEAELTWVVDGKDTPDTPPTEEKKTATVYTYALALYKVNENGTALSGAEFSIKKGEQEIYAIGESSPYTYTTDKNATGATNRFKNDENGVIVIKGVPAGTYSVTEEKAPEGYNKLTDPVNVEAILEKEYKKEVTLYKKGDTVIATEETGATTEIVDLTDKVDCLVASKAILNNKGQLLPSTGGIGTTIFYIVGAILVVGAAVLLVTKKRMSKEV